MAVAYFPSLASADVLDVAFATIHGQEMTLRLLVDSGFTGQSSFVLLENTNDILHAPALSSEATGALQGVQKRALVVCHIPALSFHIAALAILTDVANLELPEGVQGIVGLRFLRLFRRWGAERLESATWRFFLEL